MESLRKSILDCREHAKNDDDFIKKLHELFQQYDADVYKEAVKLIADKDLESEKAEKCWQDIIKHRQDLSGILNRQVDLTTTLSDYFFSKAASPGCRKIVDISTFETMLEQMHHDPLTGLLNKSYFKASLNQQILLSKRHNNDLSVLFLDIDDFKEINDSMGHYSGDLVLKNFADTIKDELRESDIVSRFGGDEFVVLMPNTSKLNALIISDRLCRTVKKKAIKLKDKDIHITLSAGIAGYPLDADNSETLLNLADRALYMAKGAGKNNVSLFKEDKRRFLRIEFDSPVKVKQLGFDRTRTLSGKGKDIAIGGILFENSEPIPIGTRVQVSVPINKEADSLLLIGTIVRIELLDDDRYDIGMALSFKEMEKTARDEISKFLVSQAT